MINFVADKNSAGLTLKEYFAICGYSTEQIKRWKFHGDILVNGQHQTVRYVLQEGDCVQLQTDKRLLTPKFAPEAARVLFADKHLYVAVKPQGVPTHPDRAHKNNTFGNMLATYFGKEFELHIVTRLDMLTSGLILGALDEITAQKLSTMQENREIEKHYLCLVEGSVEKSFCVNLPLARKDNKSYVDENGKEAMTQFECLEQRESTTLLEAIPKTGRTHQIRAHLAHLGHPIVGDTLYGGTKAQRLMLHCFCLRFVRPLTEETICIKDEIRF